MNLVIIVAQRIARDAAMVGALFLRHRLKLREVV